MVDEFQDTDPLQNELIETLWGGGEGGATLFVVGDQKQSIYRFRHADLGLFRDYTARALNNPEAAKYIVLDQNFRTAKGLLEKFNAARIRRSSTSGSPRPRTTRPPRGATARRCLTRASKHCAPSRHTSRTKANAQTPRRCACASTPGSGGNSPLWSKRRLLSGTSARKFSVPSAGATSRCSSRRAPNTRTSSAPSNASACPTCSRRARTISAAARPATSSTSFRCSPRPTTRSSSLAGSPRRSAASKARRPRRS